MNRWRAEYDDGIWRFYRDGMELGLYEKGDVVVDALNVAESRIAELEAAQRWIPVSERLPEEDDGYCLICVDFDYITMAYYDKKYGWNGQFEGWNGTITHWMPLPEPPDEVQS